MDSYLFLILYTFLAYMFKHLSSYYYSLTVRLEYLSHKNLNT